MQDRSLKFAVPSLRRAGSCRWSLSFPRNTGQTANRQDARPVRDSGQTGETCSRKR